LFGQKPGQKPTVCFLHLNAIENKQAFAFKKTRNKNEAQTSNTIIFATIE